MPASLYESMPRALRRLLDVVDRIERGIVLIAFTVLVIAVFVDVGARELIGRGIASARELAVFAMTAVALIGIDLATRDDLHLRPRFAEGWLPMAWQHAMPRIANALGAAILFGLAVLAACVVNDTLRLAERSPVLRLPVASVQFLLPLAFGLSACRLALRAVWPRRPDPPPA